MLIMPERRWRGTTFGGKKDQWDFANGSARFPSKKPGESPAQYYARLPEWNKAYFVPSMADYDYWPQDKSFIYSLSDLKKYKEKTVFVGTSWFLNTDNVDYFAFPIHAWTSEIRKAAEKGRAWLRVTNDQGVTVEGRIIDAGPAPAFADYTVDMSNHAHKTLNCDGKTRNLVSVELFFT
ncbi:MAG: hypothetical protein Q7U74_07215 [Saprospiraceae bacterium]|nr:hypothetical protein [Saprospiraceae bacterium]